MTQWSFFLWASRPTTSDGQYDQLHWTASRRPCYDSTPEEQLNKINYARSKISFANNGAFIEDYPISKVISQSNTIIQIWIEGVLYCHYFFSWTMNWSRLFCMNLHFNRACVNFTFRCHLLTSSYIDIVLVRKPIPYSPLARKFLSKWHIDFIVQIKFKKALYTFIWCICQPGNAAMNKPILIMTSFTTSHISHDSQVLLLIISLCNQYYLTVMIESIILSSSDLLYYLRILISSFGYLWLARMGGSAPQRPMSVLVYLLAN